LRDIVDDLKLFCEALELNKFFIVGWGMGSQIALNLAAVIPESIEKIIVMNSMGIRGTGIYKMDEQFKLTNQRVQTLEEAKKHPIVMVGANVIKERNFGGAYDLCVGLLFSGTTKPEKDERDLCTHEYMMCRAHEELLFAINCFNISKYNNEVCNGTGEIEKVKAPTLIIAGDRDLVSPIETSQEIKEALEDLAELKIYEGVGHAFCLEKKSEFIQVLKKYCLGK